MKWMGGNVSQNMQGCRAKFRVIALVLLAICIGLAGLYSMLKPISNGCTMTYMYPTYIPVPTPKNVSSMKYGLHLYHEGWRKIDFNDHLKTLSGVPVLFIPGNGGSYKQVRSVAAESDRAYQGGPLEHSFYQEASLTLREGVDFDVTSTPLPYQYTSMLDWFAVDLEGEHSAMDGRILEEHTDYVVYAIHRILDHYKESHDARVKEGAAVSRSPPRSVILVGHSMGGFVARAAIVHPHLRKSAVETVLTLSSPHQSPPLALQPSLGQYYARVNHEWRKGYEVQTSSSGHHLSDPLLSHVVVVSISGGYHDYQVRSNLQSLDGIVPPTHGFMISSTSMKNVWLSMEHQVILWCNQLVVQVSHTLLSLIDQGTGQPISDVRKRLAIFTKMLHSGIPPNFNWLKQPQLPHIPIVDGEAESGSQAHRLYSCPNNIHWSDDALERDLYIETTTVTVLAMDGRRRWLDIEKLGSNGKNHFVFVTNLSPCSGVRLHLWPEKGTSVSTLPINKRVLEVTSKMVQIPSGPAPRQVEPGTQTEQAPPSAVFWLHPEDMRGFRYLTISVAPRLAVSGRPPPATSMGVGQFFKPEDGETALSSGSLIRSMFSLQEMILNEDHPLALNLSFSVSLGLMPVTLSVKTTGCGIRKSEFTADETGEMEIDRLCKLRCFPPVALAWDVTSGLHIFPNLFSETILVDSSPALWTSSLGSEKTNVILLIDPHCSYKTSVGVNVTAAAKRFSLLYFPQITGFAIAVVFFALMRQARQWELDLPIPSLLTAVESNLRMPLPFLCLALLPILFALVLSCLISLPLPPAISFISVSTICYLCANGVVAVLISASQLLFYVSASLHVFIKKRSQTREHNFSSLFTAFLSSKVVRIMRFNPLFDMTLVSLTLVCFAHPALGLLLLVISHAVCCHNSLSSFLMASFHSHTQTKELIESGNRRQSGSEQFIPQYDGEINSDVPQKESNSSSPDSVKSYGDTQLEIFNHRHGLLVLHLLAMLMFVPSLIAWIQRMGIGQSLPWFLDSVLCIGVLLHGVCDSKPEFNFFFFPFPGIQRWEINLSFGYLLGGYFSYICGLALAPYRTFYPMAAIGFISCAFRIIEKRSREKGEMYHHRRKHSHKH
ncbi:uncharacterized protein LOC125847215 isoform X1 [Solanum stenotomum]|uniref:uncharacterized protein LOC125847215 isoform X1 n=1 Tax=Solanum stenotomum TaxID=172797 RepID=UPI0020D11BD1|nr:uncharacterized protein LOC125847215 isoform X1 [Solanum stenotomum]XP_049382839.1 uncharacterized protein LOC125847215 isoform X1 [Solanum stenotomum]